MRAGTAFPYLLAAAVALPAGLRLLSSGFWSSGDGVHHVHRIAALTGYLQQGVLFPRWIGDFSFGYGAPVFIFYSPLSYFLAQIFASLGAVWAMKLTMLAGLIASAVLLYHFAQAHTGRWPALAAAAVYTLVPYRFVDLYPRAAFAEHMAFLWLPLILWAFDGISEGKRRAWQVVGWAGLVLTHSFTALMFAPFFALYLGWHAWSIRQWRPLVDAATSLALAVVVTAFFWLPLGLESKYAGLSAVEVGQGYSNHLVPLRWLAGPLIFDYSTGGGRPDYYFAFGFVPVVLLVAALPVLWLARRAKPTSARRMVAFGVLTGLLALFMVSRTSTLVWQVVAPLLAPIQFPWRFLGMATFGTALAAAGIVAAVRSTRAQAFSVLALVALMYVTSTARLPFEATVLAAEDVVAEKLWEFDRETGQAGTTWGGEFIPVGVREQRWALGREAEAALDGPTGPDVSFDDVTRGPDSYTFTATSRQTWIYRYHAFYFPGWQVRAGGERVATGASGELGLVTAEIPAGSHQIEVSFERTPVRNVALGMTLAGLLLWAARFGLLSLAAEPSIRRKRLVLALLFLLLVGLVLANTWGVGVNKWEPALVGSRLGDVAQLVAYDAAATRDGRALEVTLHWFALRDTAQNYKVFVHLLGPNGQVVAQHDGDPVGGYTPTSRWKQGEMIADTHRLPLGEGWTVGEYELRAGMYEVHAGEGASFRNLEPDPPTGDGRVVLGPVRVGR